MLPSHRIRAGRPSPQEGTAIPSWRLLVLSLGLASLFAGALPLAAQEPASWLSGYPEQRPDGCVWYVARWSDGSFSATPWECPPGAQPERADGGLGMVRGYPEQRPDGCRWYVTAWRDGTFSAVPFFCPAGVIALKEGTAPLPSPAPTPGRKDGLEYYPLGGWLAIEEVSPPIGSELAANGRVFLTYHHHATGLPPGWRMGYRIYGTYLTRDGRLCRDCYLAEGVQGSPRFYQPGPSLATWTGPPDAVHRYQRVQLCFTVINPETNEVRWTNVCDERTAPGEVP